MRNVSLILLVSLLMICGSVQAQKGLKVGAFGMPTVSTLFNADDRLLYQPGFFQQEFLPNMAGGLVLGWNPGAAFGIRLNVLYTQAGVRHSTRDLASGTSTCRYRGEEYLCDLNTTRLEYLKIPLMIGFHTADPTVSKISFSAYAGLQMNLLTRAFEYTTDTEYILPIPPNVTDYPDTYALYTNRTYSVVGEVGFDIKLVDDFVLNLRLRGDYGLDDAEDKTASFRVTEAGQTNRQDYWPSARAASYNASLGVLIGITYTLGGNRFPKSPSPASSDI